MARTTKKSTTAVAAKPVFDKEAFKEQVVENVRNLFRRTVEEADQQQLFQAVAYAVKDQIIEKQGEGTWLGI